MAHGKRTDPREGRWRSESEKLGCLVASSSSGVATVHSRVGGAGGGGRGRSREAPLMGRGRQAPASPLSFYTGVVLLDYVTYTTYCTNLLLLQLAIWRDVTLTVTVLLHRPRVPAG